MKRPSPATNIDRSRTAIRVGWMAAALVFAAFSFAPSARAQTNPYSALNQDPREQSGQSDNSQENASRQGESGTAPTQTSTQGSGAQGGRRFRGSRGGEKGRAEKQPGVVQTLNADGKYTVSRAASRAGTATPPAIALPTGTVRASLFFRPLDLFLRTGESFTVDVVLSDEVGIHPDAFDVSIAYDPQRLQFEGYDASALLPNLADPRKDFSVKREVGRLDISATLNKAPTENRLVLFTLGFTARDAVGRTALRFLTPPDGASAVYSKGANILGSPEQELRGVVDALVLIQPGSESKETEAAIPQLGDAKPNDMGGPDTEWTESPDANEAENTAFLTLQPPESTLLTQGQDFWVDLVLHNPDRLPIESIGVVARFDPKVLQVIDEDQNNWIADGVNIWDGAFHENYPFDLFAGDRADNSTGRIHYAMARHTAESIFPTGVFARIHFKAIAPADITPIALSLKPEGLRRQTYVRAYGIERQGETWDRPGSLTRLALRVLPPAVSNQTPPPRVELTLD